MSRHNIQNARWSPRGTWYFVTFATKNGSALTYRYDPASGRAIDAGADPKDFVGVQTGRVDASEIAEAVETLGELL